MAPPKHPYDRCRDKECERLACLAWREGLQEGYRDGHKDGWDEGWNQGFPAGVASCPLAHE